VKRSKERITITLIIGAVGEKFILQIIRKSAHVGALKNITNINTAFGVD
jgi:hypothetical protein